MRVGNNVVCDRKGKSEIDGLGNTTRDSDKFPQSAHSHLVPQRDQIIDGQ